jgi:hypothetical protein
MTAVEWLEKEFVKLEHTIGVHHKMYELLEQAKEMEKRQIIEACDYGKECLFKGKYLKSETYYTETFNK